MPDDDGLDRLSSPELHDLAVSRAKRHLDVRFFWELMRLLPAAEAGAGKLDEAQADVMKLSAHLNDVTESGRGEVADLLRRSGLEVAQHDDELRVQGLDPAGIGELVGRAGLYLHELTLVRSSLEDAFMTLTADAVEYAGAVEVAR